MSYSFALVINQMSKKSIVHRSHGENMCRSQTDGEVLEGEEIAEACMSICTLQNLIW